MFLLVLPQHVHQEESLAAKVALVRPFDSVAQLTVFEVLALLLERLAAERTPIQQPARVSSAVCVQVGPPRELLSADPARKDRPLVGSRVHYSHVTLERTRVAEPPTAAGARERRFLAVVTDVDVDL